ncbi:concanavalin A-like lectin/glucanase [Setomelanomma holmii]|uniref:Concanavalin A-like lectin/glucanase n=1 Tax=Setomelanomma holmii TaxID=210430 RepID=A0A9P4LTZ4_9PLEO|nr:concanavalin A-like lectin/glucanase [Setomelanomma holmii]
MNHSDPEKRSSTSSAHDPMSSRSTTSDTNHIDVAQEQENPFATPGARTPNLNTPSVSYPNSRPESATGSGTASSYQYFPRGAYFRSRRVKKGEIERPWLKEKDPREKWITIIPLIGLFLGLCISGVLVWDGVRSVAKHKYCQILDENFSSWNSNVWTKEVEVGGYGNGQFEMTTHTDENVFIRDGILNIKPTLQDRSLLETDNVLDLRGQGCTGPKWTDCVTSTNTTNGTIVNPVKSGRINTKLGASIKFGRVEVVAKLPAGDWLWPAIWMLPKDNVYGDWPRSGEIDILESRGNNYTYAQGGNNIASSTLHFGPDFENDGWWRNNVKRKALHTTYASGYNVFGVEWSEKYIFTYINSRLMQVMYTHFDEPFWNYGRFPLADSNGTRLQNPWAHTNSNTAPFDQDFYLVLNVAVGSDNGWFQDGGSGKPWLDGSPTAKKDFWNAKDQWYPTWQDGGQMQVKSVKMWQQSGYNGCTA